MATQLLLILAVAYQPRLFMHIFPTSKEQGKEATNTPARQRPGTIGVVSALGTVPKGLERGLEQN